MAMTFETSILRPQPSYANSVEPTSATSTQYRPKRDTCDRALPASSAVEVRLDTFTSWRLRPIALFISAAIVAVAVIGFGSDAAATGTETVNPDSIEIYVVQPGDTLWEIANDLSAPGEDVRQLVDSLEDIAGGSQLEVGQRLIIDQMMLRQ